MNLTYVTGFKNFYCIPYQNLASSEEWGDHLQSDVDTTSETSSCGSEPEISQQEDNPQESETELGQTASNIHAMNILTVSLDVKSQLIYMYPYRAFQCTLFTHIIRHCGEILRKLLGLRPVDVAGDGVIVE